jgi:hypothetical protein
VSSDANCRRHDFMRKINDTSIHYSCCHEEEWLRLKCLTVYLNEHVLRIISIRSCVCSSNYSNRYIRYSHMTLSFILEYYDILSNDIRNDDFGHRRSGQRTHYEGIQYDRDNANRTKSDMRCPLLSYHIMDP